MKAPSFPFRAALPEQIEAAPASPLENAPLGGIATADQCLGQHRLRYRVSAETRPPVRGTAAEVVEEHGALRVRGPSGLVGELVEPAPGRLRECFLRGYRFLGKVVDTKDAAREGTVLVSGHPPGEH